MAKFVLLISYTYITFQSDKSTFIFQCILLLSFINIQRLTLKKNHKLVQSTLQLMIYPGSVIKTVYK